jgi:uncharacterized protein (DUF2252 family)
MQEDHAVPALATAERLALGKALRADVPLDAHGSWRPADDRGDPLAVLEAQAATRLPDLVPIRRARMAVSPFTFLRGAAAVMAADLAPQPSPGIRVQACGDAHLANFGLFAAPDRRLVFDLNDFDETLPAPFEWDVKRLGASLVVASRDNGLDEEAQRRVCKAGVRSYQRWMRALAHRDFLEVWYARLDADDVMAELERRVGRKVLGGARTTVAKAERRTSLQALRRFAAEGPDGWRILPDPPRVATVPDDERAAINDLVRAGLDDYATTLTPDRRVVLDHYEYVDVARKVVGVGSVGTLALMVLLMGSKGDALFLQIKEAQPSVLEAFAGAGTYAEHGERVVQGQRIMQSASDSFLGWFRGRGERAAHCYVRQLRDKKGTFETAQLAAPGMAFYAELCGAALARAHARSDRAPEISGYVGTGKRFGRAIADFAVTYAEVTERDHAALVGAIAAGRLEALDA